MTCFKWHPGQGKQCTCDIVFNVFIGVEATEPQQRAHGEKVVR